MSLEQPLKSLHAIIENGQLREYILELGEFENPNPRNMYTGWNRLVAFYEESTTSDNDKREIQKCLLDLVDEANSYSKTASLTLLRILGVPELEQIIGELIQSGEYHSLDLRNKKEVLVCISERQFDSHKQFLFDQLLDLGEVANLISWSDKALDPNHETANDKWRMQILASSYETGRQDVRKLVERQLGSVAYERTNPKMKFLLLTFSESNTMSYPVFCRLVFRLLKKETIR